jgi:uncharacterized protein YkwD
MLQFQRMRQTLKRFFTPTEQDNMLPLGLGQEAFFLYFLLALVIILSPVYVRISELASLSSPNIIDSQARTLIALVNQERTAAGLPVLTENQKLDQAAAGKVDDMFVNQYFAHFSPVDNKSPWDFFKAVDYHYYAAGENLAVDFVSAEDANTALMNSPTHRANILSPLYSDIGISVKQGEWNGHSSIMIAQYFGKERVVAPVMAQATPPPPPAPSGGSGIATIPAPTSVPAVPPPAPVHVLGADSGPATTVIPPSGEQLGAPVSADTLPTPEKPIIEPVLLPAPIPVAPLEVKLTQVLTTQNEIRVLAFVAILSLLVSLVFLITRGGEFSIPIAVRIFVLLVLFGYIGIFGIGQFSMSAISPPPAAVMVIGS